MQRLAHLGELFATLRSLRGLSHREVADAAKVQIADVEASERGDAPPEVRRALAPLYGLNAEELAVGVAEPAETPSMTVFLLHGHYQDFDATDLRPLERALRAARIFAGSPAGRSGFERRLTFTPSRPSGPLPRDAARQGYRLARRVRAALGLGGDVIGDLRALLEERLGVAVLVDSLATLDLRAASTLDVSRASAAVVLAADDESRQHTPQLARVYLAHELCHLLFDPVAPGRVQIALDERPQGRVSQRQESGVTALLESRAKGFAAEFLLPQEGLFKLLGVPSVPESSVAAAREMIAKAVSHFHTSWEIAAYHLKNLGFYADELVVELLVDRASTAPADSTSLPRAGEGPVCLQGLSHEFDAWRGTDVLASEAPPFVAAARSYAERAASALAEHTLCVAYAEVEAGRPIAATNELMDHIDALLSGDEIERAVILLERLDPSRLPPRVLTALLSLTFPARDLLGDTRTRLFDRCKVAFEETWKLPADRRARIEARLR